MTNFARTFTIRICLRGSATKKHFAKWRQCLKSSMNIYKGGQAVITDKGSEERLREPEQRSKKKQRIIDVRSVVALVASTIPLLVTMILLIIAVIKF